MLNIVSLNCSEEKKHYDLFFSRDEQNQLDWRTTASDLDSCFNKYWKTATSIHLCIVSSCIHAMVPEFSSRDRDLKTPTSLKY